MDPAEIPLFKPPEPGFRYPPALIAETKVGPFGLRCAWVGDDGDQLVILGHPEQERVTAAVKALCDGCADGGVDTIRTWARLLTECPDHHGTQPDDCLICAHATPERWWLDWTPISDLNANAHKPGYFPITVNEC